MTEATNTPLQQSTRVRQRELRSRMKPLVRSPSRALYEDAADLRCEACPLAAHANTPGTSTGRDNTKKTRNAACRGNAAWDARKLRLSQQLHTSCLLKSRAGHRKEHGLYLREQNVAKKKRKTHASWRTDRDPGEPLSGRQNSFALGPMNRQEIRILPTDDAGAVLQYCSSHYQRGPTHKTGCRCV